MHKFLALMFMVFLVGCGGGKNTQVVYLKDVFVREDNTVVAVVEVPAYHYGLLTLDNSPVALAIVVNSGEIELGQFVAGDYTLCLQLFLAPDSASVHPRMLRDFSGVEQCLGFTVVGEGSGGDQSPGGPGPKIFVRVNYDGAVLVVVRLGGWDSLVLHNVLTDEDVLVEEDNAHFVFDFECGDFVFVFELLNPETMETVAYKEFVLPCLPDDEAENPELPPKPADPRTRFLVCHDGNQLLLPWNALYAHLVLHSDQLGLCQ